MPKQSTCIFEKPFTLENDGLSQTSTRIVTHTGDPHSPTKIKVVTHLPPFVLPSYWKEFELSERDVYRLAEYLPAQLLWLSCLVHGAEVTAACLKPSFAQVDAVLISYRALAIRTLIAQEQVVFTNKQQVLDTTSQASLQHTPPLPTKEVHESMIPAITRLLYPRLKAFDVCRVPGLFEWQNRRYLPVKLEGDAIFLQRATPYINFERAKKRQRYGFASIPFIVETGGIHYALCEDGVLVTARQ